MYTHIGKCIRAVYIVCKLAEQSKMRYRTIVETCHNRAVFKEECLMTGCTVHQVKFQRCVAYIKLIAKSYVRDEVFGGILYHIERVERIEPAIIACPMQMIGKHIVAGWHMEQALRYLCRKTAFTVICGIRGTCTKLERRHIVPELRSKIYVYWRTVVLISAYHSHLLTRCKAPISVCLIVNVHPVGSVKLVILVYLLVKSLSP